MNKFLAHPTFDDILRLLRAWRLWLIGAVLGGLLGMVIYAIFPPEYRARATVMVDFNVEESWPNIPDREVFYYLDREARKLEEIAWSDLVLQQVADEVGVDVTTLRNGALSLSQPSDGGWHFYADSTDASLAAKTASAWAEVFSAKSHITDTQFEITLTQTENLPVNRVVPVGNYAMAGAGLTLALLALLILFIPTKLPNHELTK